MRSFLCGVMVSLAILAGWAGRVDAGRSVPSGGGGAEQFGRVDAQSPAPMLSIIAPAEQSETDAEFITVRATTRCGTASVEVTVNGRAPATSIGDVERADSGLCTVSRTVPLVVGNNWIMVAVRGDTGAVERRTVRVVRRETAVKRPVLYYFGVGIADYAHPSLRLRYTVKDVEDLALVLKHQEGRAFSAVRTRLLTDAAADRAAIVDAAGPFLEGVRQDDVVVLFLSGHGMHDATGSYFLAHDTNPERLRTTAVPWIFFEELLAGVKGRTLLLADASLSGDEFQNAPATGGTDTFLHELSNKVAVWAAAGPGGASLEDPTWGHGAFAKALIDGLNGGAANWKGVVTLKDLHDYVRAKVAEMTDDTQRPDFLHAPPSGEFLSLELAFTKP